MRQHHNQLVTHYEAVAESYQHAQAAAKNYGLAERLARPRESSGDGMSENEPADP